MFYLSSDLDILDMAVVKKSNGGTMSKKKNKKIVPGPHGQLSDGCAEEKFASVCIA